MGIWASRIVYAALALLLGWLTPLHAGGSSPTATDDPVVAAPATEAAPVVQVFLLAYRGQAPPAGVSGLEGGSRKSDYDPLQGRRLTGDPGYHPDVDRVMGQLNMIASIAGAAPLMGGMGLMTSGLSAWATVGMGATARAATTLGIESGLGAGFGALEGGLSTQSWEGAGYGALLGGVMPGGARAAGWGAGKALQGGAWAMRQAGAAGQRAWQGAKGFASQWEWDMGAWGANYGQRGMAMAGGMSRRGSAINPADLIPIPRYVGNGTSGVSAGADLVIPRPGILAKNLSQGERILLEKHLALKMEALQQAASSGSLKWSPGTDAYRIGTLQHAYRVRFASVFERLFGVKPKIGLLDADHPIDMIVGGMATQKLRMLHRSINRSIGSSLKLAGESAGLKDGDIIRSVSLEP